MKTRQKWKYLGMGNKLRCLEDNNVELDHEKKSRSSSRCPDQELNKKQKQREEKRREATDSCSQNQRSHKIELIDRGNRLKPMWWERDWEIAKLPKNEDM